MTVAASASGSSVSDQRSLDTARLEAHSLVATYGTPLYVYDLDVVTRRVAALRRTLPMGVSLAHAVKANPSLAVVAHLARLGLGADVASAAELRTVLRAGVEAGRVVMTGPGKRSDEHVAAVSAGAIVTVESIGELERLERVSADSGVVTRILLRATAAEEARGESVRIIGDAGGGKFGMDEGDLRIAAIYAAASPHLELLGLHRFGASNVTDAGRLVATAAVAVDLARDVLGRAGMPVGVVDVGGGLGIPYADGEPSLDVVELGRGLARVLEASRRHPGAGDLRLVLEPGRFLVGPAGAYVARVVDRKRVSGREVAILDGGINHVLRPALVGQPHRVRALGAADTSALRPAGGAAGDISDIPGERPTRATTLAGPLCTGLDVLAADVVLPELAPGDLVAVLDVGAYGFTESMPFFLSHAIPAEVAVRGGRTALVRPRTEPEEWIDRQVSPNWDDS